MYNVPLFLQLLGVVLLVGSVTTTLVATLQMTCAPVAECTTQPKCKCGRDRACPLTAALMTSVPGTPSEGARTKRAQWR